MPEDIVLERPLAAAPVAGKPLVRRRVYIFPTRPGFLFATTLVVMLLGAVNYTNSMAYLLTFLLGGVFMVCMLHTYRNLRGLVIRVERPEPAFAGGHAAFPVFLDNRGGYARIAAFLGLRDTAPGAGAPSTRLDLGAGEFRRCFLEVPAGQRGWYRGKSLRLESRYPLGLFRAWSYLDTDVDYLVYPRPAETGPLPDTTPQDSEEQSGRLAGTDDFSGFRAYRAGDPIRSIDWKALAREQGLLVKRFTGGGGNRLMLRWHETPGRDEESKLSRLCRWVLIAQRAGMFYGLELPAARVEYGTGEAHLRTCLEMLARHGISEPRG